MSDTERAAAALREYGTVERPLEVVKAICYVDGVWLIPLNDREQLRVVESALPRAAAELLALYASVVGGGREGRRSAAEWLSGEREADGVALKSWLREAGWPGEQGAVVLLEFTRAPEPGTADEAVALLRELIEPEQAVIARQGSRRVWVLVPMEEQAAESLSHSVSAWIDTMGAELFLLCRAGISGVRALQELPVAKKEAEFALEAGKLLRGKDAVHAYSRLGIARLLYGAPEQVRQEFVEEILPPAVLEALTPELRETAAVFVEHGQQVADTARALFVHRNTLLYRLERIHELTGLDPRRPLDGWTLWLALLLRSGCTSEGE